MPDEGLRLATRSEVQNALGYALRFGRRGKAHNHADPDMARIAAEVLAEHLELSGFVVMKKPPLQAHAAPPSRHAQGSDEDRTD